MKKILVVSMSAELGGIEKSLINFLKYLDKKDCSVDLMLWKKYGELLTDIPKSVNLIESPAPGNLRQIIKNCSLKRFMSYLKLKLYTKKGIPWKSFPILEKRYDIAIAYSQDGYSPYYVIDNVKAEKKFLWYHHGAYDKKETDRCVDEKYYGKYNRVITVSDANKKMLCEKFPSIVDRFDVVLNMLDEEGIKRASLEDCNLLERDAACLIVTVGRLAAEKGQAFSLEVAEILRKKQFNFKWYFVGDGPDYQKCVEKVKELKLDNNCIFVGSQINPYKYIARADIYVQFSLVESYALTVQEALILGRPIIVTNIPVLQEAIQNGYFGWSTDFDVCIAADKIMKLYNDTTTRKELIDNIAKRNSHNMITEGKLNELFGFMM